MGAILKTIDATVSADGTVTLAEKITGPAKAVLTLLVEEPEANEETLEAIAEPITGLPRFSNLTALRADLDS
jgi:hypothetical protein